MSMSPRRERAYAIPGLAIPNGKIILPGQPHGQVTKAGDPIRVRADGTNDMDFDGDPIVYPLPGRYYGSLGYLDRESMDISSNLTYR
jgi:hypothetical protein